MRIVTVHGEAEAPQIVIVNDAGRIYEPVGDENELVATDGFLRQQPGEPGDGDLELPFSDQRIVRLKQYLEYNPAYFVGMPVWRDFEEYGVYKEGQDCCL